MLVGLNRPFIRNRLDPPTRTRLAETFYQYEYDPSLRALVLFDHGDNFLRGIDVDAAQAGIIAGQRAASTAPAIDVLGNGQARRSKAVVVVVHGVAAANTRFGQDENTHGRFPGVRAVVGQGDAGVRAPGRRSGGSGRAVQARRAV